MIIILLTSILTFGIIKPLTNNAQSQTGPEYPTYNVNSYQTYWTYVYVPIMTFYTPNLLENYYYHDIDYYVQPGLNGYAIVTNMTKDIVRAQIAYGSYEEAYDRGYEEGQNYVWNLIENDQVYSAKDIIIGIFDAPLRILEKAFTFEIFGIEVYNIILFVMTMGIVYFVWKKVKK